MDIEQSPTYVALPEHAKPAWLRAIRALPPAWLVTLATGEGFEGKEDCHQRLQGRGEIDAAFAWLDRAYGQRDHALSIIKTDWLMTKLRGDLLHYQYPTVALYVEHLNRYSSASVPLVLRKGRNCRG